MAIHSTLDIATFRATFQMFASSTAYPDVMLSTCYAQAGNYISQADNFCRGLNGVSLDYALQLITAHMLVILSKMNVGKSVGTVVNSSVDSVSVSLLPPPVKTAFQFWLSSTPYGVELWALLSLRSAGGWTVGGGPESASFRKAGGRFW